MVPTEATVSMATPLGSLKYSAFWGLFSGSGKGSSVGGKECSVVSQDKSSAEWRSRQLVRAQHGGLADTKLWKSSWVRVWGRGSEEKAVSDFTHR